MEERNDRQELYEEFESEIVKKGNTEAFFDENDLVEIFDYASDFSNDIVKIEVLLYGAQHYPKSEALATRRAWLYFSYGDLKATRELNDRLGKKGVLNKLLSLRAYLSDFEHLSPDYDVKPDIEKILDSTEVFDDEEIIQFTDLVLDMSLDDWLQENKQRIQAKCTYPTTFLYTYADRAEDCGDFDLAISLFEEITMLEPFNAEIWLRLASLQLDITGPEAALTSAEYALAINPDSIMGLRIKGVALFRIKGKPEIVVDIFRKVISSPDSDESDLTTYTAALVETGNEKEAIKIMTSYLNEHPKSKAAIDIMLVLDREKAEKYLISYLSDYSIKEKDVIEWARSLVVNGQFEAAALICTMYNDIEQIVDEIPFFVEVCYFALAFDQVINIYLNLPEKAKNAWPYQPSIAIPYIMSLVRTDQSQKALKEAQEMLKVLRACRHKYNFSQMSAIYRTTPPDSAALQLGTIEVLKNIIHALKSTDKISPDEFDPMVI